jgi:hypothetical protein
VHVVTRVANVTAPSLAIAHTGRATTLVPGRYEVAELDGAAERGEVYVHNLDGALVRINPGDRNITIEREQGT